MAELQDDQRPTAEEDAAFDAKMTVEDPRYPARKAASEALDKYIGEWINGYEFDDGECCIAPDEQTSFLIYDAFAGLTGDEEYQRLHAAWKALCGPQSREVTWLRQIVKLVDWDEHGAIKREDTAWTWESIARMALDFARAGLGEDPGSTVPSGVPEHPKSETGHGPWHDLNSAADAVQLAAKQGDWDAMYCERLATWLRQLASALGVHSGEGAQQ